MPKRKTQEQFVNEVYKLVGNEYSVMGIYSYNNVPIKMKHEICGYEYDVRPSNFLTGYRCPNCNGGVSKTHQDFVNDVFELTQGEYEVKYGIYKNNRTKITMRHNSCGNEFEITRGHFMNGQRCPFCNGYRRVTHEIFEKEVYDLEGENYTLIGRYEKCNIKVTIRHNECGYQYTVLRGNFLKGERCPRCGKCGKKTNKDFIADVFELEGNSYSVISKYSRAKDPIILKHNVCGHEYETLPTYFMRGQRCPICSYGKSKGEFQIRQILNKNEIAFIPEYTFGDCQFQNKLKFDFAIFDPKNNLICLIEYDGGQHFFSVNIFGGEEEFKKTQLRDQIKNNYCRDNNIPLLRIPYWEFDNIEEILTSFLLN